MRSFRIVARFYGLELRTECRCHHRGGDVVQVKGHDLIKPDGEKLFIVGTNLGNWLNPEGYMFGFQRMNAPRQINDLFSHLVGPDAAAEFWQQFKDNYITATI